MGITGGLLIGSHSLNAEMDQGDVFNQDLLAAGNSNQNAVPSSNNKNAATATMNKNAGKVENEKYINEEEVVKQLNPQAKKTFEGLSAEGKALALKLVNQSCKGKNECKGLNSCKTETNECAGKGACRGTSPANFKDKNLAVKVAADKMADKRKRLAN